MTAGRMTAGCRPSVLLKRSCKRPNPASQPGRRPDGDRRRLRDTGNYWSATAFSLHPPPRPGWQRRASKRRRRPSRHWRRVRRVSQQLPQATKSCRLLSKAMKRPSPDRRPRPCPKSRTRHPAGRKRTPGKATPARTSTDSRRMEPMGHRAPKGPMRGSQPSLRRHGRSPRHPRSPMPSRRCCKASICPAQ